MNQSLKETYDSNLGGRVKGAMKALSPLSQDNTDGAFFLNATNQKNSKKDIGWNWKQFNRKIYISTGEKGETTFFKYNPNKKENKTHYKNIWP